MVSLDDPNVTVTPYPMNEIFRDPILIVLDQMPPILTISSHTFMQLLFEGGDYSRVATIRGWRLFEGGDYSRVATIRGWRLFEGGDYLRAAFITLGSSQAIKR